MLETVLGDGVIEEVCDQAVAAGLVTPPERRRLMSLPFIMRVVVAMTLLPDADYPEVIRALTGLRPRTLSAWLFAGEGASSTPATTTLSAMGASMH
jgi:hypothetical protein